MVVSRKRLYRRVTCFTETLKTMLGLRSTGGRYQTIKGLGLHILREKTLSLSISLVRGTLSGLTSLVNLREASIFTCFPVTGLALRGSAAGLWGVLTQAMKGRSGLYRSGLHGSTPTDRDWETCKDTGFS